MQYDRGTVHDMIYGRRSVRRYADAVDLGRLKTVVDMGLKGAAALPDCPKPTVQLMDGDYAESIFTGIMGHYGKVLAPAYLVVSARPEGPFFTQAGYVVEQLVLWLAAQGYGTCWIGIPLNTDEILKRCPLPEKEQYIILLAVGKPMGDTPLMRKVEGYQRREMQEMVTGEILPVYGPLLKAARLAPSASNGQPWHFVCKPEGIDLYCALGRGLIKKRYYHHLNRIDCGIALSHLCLAAWQAGCDTEFNKISGTTVFAKDKKKKKLTPIMGLRIKGSLNKS